MTAETLSGGFRDAPVEAAYTFRAAMSAMARPGRIERVAGVTPPAPLSVAAGTLILTLCDVDTPLHIAGPHNSEQARAWIAFHTGAPICGPGGAAFALGNLHDLQPLKSYPVGTPEYPDRSATLIVETDELRAEGCTLAGPGIADHAYLSLPDPDVLRRNAAQFPLGLDFYLTCGDRLAGLPRSTRIESRGHA